MKKDGIFRFFYCNSLSFGPIDLKAPPIDSPSKITLENILICTCVKFENMKIFEFFEFCFGPNVMGYENR